MRKYIVAMDAMKGCLTSEEASSAFAAGIHDSYPDADVIVVPVADGGEGTAKVLASRAGLSVRVISLVAGPMGMDVKAEWWYDPHTATAYIDMAQSSGVTLVRTCDRDPLNATSYGFGQLISKALDAGASVIVAGLGGSATVDGGIGACQALGIRFLDSVGNPLPKFAGGVRLSDIAGIDIASLDGRLGNSRLILVCDVVNPFTGDGGAARVFGPQKGASQKDVSVLEDGLENFRKLVFRSSGVDLNEVPGSGAAGGCAGGLMALAGGVICDGTRYVLDALSFDSIVSGASALVTGEGSSDAQTLMGKLPSGILSLGKDAGVPVALVAGMVRDESQLKEAGFSPVVDINDREIINATGTSGCDPMDPRIAAVRLRTAGARFGALAKNN